MLVSELRVAIKLPCWANGYCRFAVLFLRVMRAIGFEPTSEQIDAIGSSIGRTIARNSKLAIL